MADVRLACQSQSPLCVKHCAKIGLSSLTKSAPQWPQILSKHDPLAVLKSSNGILCFLPASSAAVQHHTFRPPQHGQRQTSAEGTSIISRSKICFFICAILHKGQNQPAALCRAAQIVARVCCVWQVCNERQVVHCGYGRMRPQVRQA